MQYEKPAISDQLELEGLLIEVKPRGSGQVWED